MSKGINKWIGIGNACADPEVRHLPPGGTVTNLTIACNDGYKDKNTGKMVDTTEFVKLVFFNRLSEVVSEYVRKGAKVYVEGSLRTRQWEQDGQKRFMTEIVASNLQMLDSRSGGPASVQSSEPRQEAPRQQNSAPDFDNFDNDIPFD